ncbi:MAG TPA: hypothetical protein VM510_05020, partial [Caulifigura sp.]|nr:hypothetical protein [Caulifigura sp.]
LLARREGGSSRPSRTAGAVTSFDVSGAYREGVVRHFTGAPDVDLSVTGLGRVTQSVWQAMQDRVHCRLRISAIESRHQNEPGPAVLRSLQEEVVRGRFCGGAVFGDDGRQLWLIDRRDGLLSDRRIAEMLSRELLRESGARELRLVAPEDLMWTSLNVSGTRLFTCGTTEEEIVAAMRGHQAVIGCDGAGRFWIARPAVHCDAMVTLAYLARGLSDDARSGARFAA